MILTLLLLLLLSGNTFASVLSDAANGMAVGTWTTFNISSGGDSELFYGSASGRIVPYSMSATWDPVHEIIRFCGHDHGGDKVGIQRCVQYDEANNRWIPFGQYTNNMGGGDWHGFEQNIVNWFTGDYWFKTSDLGTDSTAHYWKLPWGSGTWEAKAISTGSVGSIAEAGIFWSGTMTGVTPGVGAIIRHSCTGTISIIDPSGSGSTIANVTLPGWSAGGYQCWAEYSHVKNVAILGGGENNYDKIYRLDSNGTITRLTDIGFYNVGISNGFVTEDPVTGNFIFLGGSTYPGYEYNPTTNTYTQLTGTRTPPTDLPNWDLNRGGTMGGTTITVPISKYGVILYVRCDASQPCSYYLYKHAVALTDFQTRCNAAGVLRCIAFDSSSELGLEGDPAQVAGVTHGMFNNNTVNHACETDRCPTIDTSGIAASGTGSLKFVVPSNTEGAYAGQWFTTFTEDFQRFFENSTFYIQFRYRMDTNAVNSIRTRSGAGIKAMIAGWGSTAARGTNYYSSCSLIELVIQGLDNWGIPMMYHACGTFTRLVDPGVSQWNSSDENEQNARPSPYCFHYAPTFADLQPPNGNCFVYLPNEWMTFKVRVDVGNYTGPGGLYTNSRVRMWAAHEGQSSVPVIDKTMDLNAGYSDDKAGWGNLWLLPYSGSGSNILYGGTFWYDELIISTQDIADPAISSGGVNLGSNKVLNFGSNKTFNIGN